MVQASSVRRGHAAAAPPSSPSAFLLGVLPVTCWADARTIRCFVLVYDRVRVQLQALGQMAPGVKRRAVSDTNTYWRLTEIGAAQLINIQAVRKPKPKPALALAPANEPSAAAAPTTAGQPSPAATGKKA